MELKRIRYFRSVVEAGGLNKAARALSLTPGALSKALAQLQSDLDVELFVRAGRGLSLTDAGRSLYNASDRVVDEYARMLAAVAERSEASAASLRIASFEPFTTHMLGALLDGAVAPQPLRVLEIGVARIGEAVALREADVGLTYVPFLRPELEYRALANFEFGIFVRRRAFAGTPVAEIPFAAPVAAITGSAANLKTVDGWPADRVPRTVRYHLTSLESALALVRRGLCAIFLPEFVAGLHNETAKRACQLERVPNPPRMRAVRHSVQLVTRTSEDSRRFATLTEGIKTVVARGTETVLRR